MPIAALLCLLAACTVDGRDSTPAATCQALADVACAKLIECYSPELLAAAGVPASPVECVAAMSGELACQSRTEETACPAGLTWDPLMASSCLAEYGALTCEVMEGRHKDQIPSCAQACR